ncbi:acyltransferase [Telmatospirillum sp.]|uniref:acyltransferase family protein n=1 Tax=Telmatospirillum sp. TaxID=2079197 RepID=UPI002848CF94|nr:acyltransferase [Telmatospirillum sp.]MDR3436497.1 acyltransferase [Telmatospirillum sp.]
MKPGALSLARSPRLPGLDLIRAVAIIWVMVYHAMNFGLIPDPDHWYVSFGWIGVDLFFGLSGFLIAGQLLKPWSLGLKPDYKKFFQRRLLRTLPAYVVIIAVYFLLPAFRERPRIQPFWQFATFTENLFFDVSPRSFSHVWSLCVEEQFYVVFPILAALLAWRPNPRRVALAFVAVVVGGMLIRGGLWLVKVGSSPFANMDGVNGQAYMDFIYYPTWSRLDGLLAGVLAATIKVFRPAAWGRIVSRPNLILCLGLIGLSFSMVLFGSQVTTFVPAVFGYPLLASSIAAIVIAGSECRGIIGSRSIPGARILATGAYSLYLTQKLAYHVVDAGYIPGLGNEGWMRFFVAIGVALFMGALLHGLIERPFLRLRDRWDGPSRSPIATAG